MADDNRGARSGALTDLQPADRLESWKEVAAYLKRDVTTVRRWERKEGLPVYRHQHDKQGSVYAFKPELDAWRRKTTTSRPDAARPAFSAFRPLVLMALAVIIACFVGWRAWRPATPPPDPASGTVAQVTSEAGMELFPSLSPDGSWLVYAGGTGSSIDIFIRPVGGAKPSNLTPDFAGRDTEPAVSPDGSTIAFRSDRNGGGIFLMDATGQSVRQVADVGFNPAWAPDGAHLVVASEEVEINPGNRTGIGQLWIVDTRTGDRHRIDVPDGVQPSWSPDGRRIAYWALPFPGTQRDIWTVDPKGGPPVRVTDDPPNDWNPVWSPDSRYLNFVSDRGGIMNLWRVAIDTETGRPSSLPERVVLPSVRVAHPSFSFYGQRLTWASITSVSNLQAVTIDPVHLTITGPEVSITTGSGRTQFDVSPDEAWMVFGRDNILHVARLDGGDSHPVSRAGMRARMPVWSPDGSRIAFQADPEGKAVIWTVSIDGSHIQKAVEARGDVGSAVWAPDGDRLAYADFSTGPGRVGVRSLRTGVHEELPPFDSARSFRPTSWSPDGEHLAGHVRDVGGIVVYSFRDRIYEKLTSGRDFGPAWLSDGQRLLFESDDRIGKLMIVDRLTRNVRTLEPWSAGPDDLNVARITRAGTRVFLGRVHQESDVWMVRRP
jgi:Tol biopolymer transport system component